MRLEDLPPGMFVQIDFDRLGLIPAGDGRRLAWGLSVVLPCSRHQYLNVAFSQKLADVIEFVGGVPAMVTLDHLKAAVV